MCGGRRILKRLQENAALCWKKVIYCTVYSWRNVLKYDNAPQTDIQSTNLCCHETLVQWGGGCGSIVAAWLVRLHWNAGSFVCLGEEWVRRRMPLMIAERKNEPPGSVLSVSAPPPPPPHSCSLCLSIFFFLCVRTFTVPSLSPLRPRSPGTTAALSWPCEHTPLLYWAPTFARGRETRGRSSYSYPHRCPWMDVASTLNGELFATHLTLFFIILSDDEKLHLLFFYINKNHPIIAMQAD